MQLLSLLYRLLVLLLILLLILLLVLLLFLLLTVSLCYTVSGFRFAAYSIGAPLYNIFHGHTDYSTFVVSGRNISFYTFLPVHFAFYGASERPSIDRTPRRTVATRVFLSVAFIMVIRLGQFESKWTGRMVNDTRVLLLPE